MFEYPTILYHINFSFQESFLSLFPLERVTLLTDISLNKILQFPIALAPVLLCRIGVRPALPFNIFGTDITVPG